MRAVLQHEDLASEPAFSARDDPFQPVEIQRISEHVRRYDRSGSAGDDRLQPVEIHVVVIERHVHEAARVAAQHNRVRDDDAGVGREHNVGALDSERFQESETRTPAVRKRDGFRCLECLGELDLEGAHTAPPDQGCDLGPAEVRFETRYHWVAAAAMGSYDPTPTRKMESGFSLTRMSQLVIAIRTSSPDPLSNLYSCPSVSGVAIHRSAARS